MLLAVDTSTRYAGVALYRPAPSETVTQEPGRLFACRNWYSSVNHTSELMPAVSQILASQQATLAEVDAIALALGPGGFSALRVGMSVAKGLGATAGKPVIGVGTLDLEAQPYLGREISACAILDAGRNEVASARFDRKGQRLRDDLVGTPDELIEEILSGNIEAVQSQPEEEPSGGAQTLFCGEGVINWGELIRGRLEHRALVIESSPAARLWSLCQLGWERFNQGEVSDIATLQPNYLRMPSIGGPKRRDRDPQRS